MIFNKDKKGLSREATKNNSVEDTAIDRWRTINTTDDDDGEFTPDHKDDPNFKERSSFLNSLMKDGPAKARKELIPNEGEISAGTQNGAISLTNEMNSTEPLVEEMTEEESFQEFEETEIVESLQYDIFNKKDVETLNASAKKPLEEQITQTEKKPEKVEPRTPVADFAKDTEEDLKNRFGMNLKSALGEGTVIEGTFSFETPVKVNGCLTGEIKSPSALIVGEQAQVNAKIKVGTLIVLGSVEGEIEVSDLVEIRSTGSLSGEVTTKRIALEEGGVFNGACTIIP